MDRAIYHNCLPVLALSLLVTACGGGGGAAETVPRPSGELHPTVVRMPGKRVGVETDRLAPDGSPVDASCMSCHATRPPDRETRFEAELDDFHQGLHLAHGDQSCLACHDSGNYDRLGLADGRSIAFEDSMQLCAQCHGPQHRDWRNGSHGGMNGYWDLRQGPRERLSCLACHDPHAPAWKQLLPAPPPADALPHPTGAGHHE